MKALNAAQMILINCGVDQMRVVFGGFKRGKMASNTKRGPGRIHMYGKKEEEKETTADN